MYLLIYVHACVYYVSRGVKRPDIVKEILMFALRSCLENEAKFTHWMSQNLNSIFFLWIDLTYKCL